MGYHKKLLSTAIWVGEKTLDIPGYFQTLDYNCGPVAGLNVVHAFYPNKSARNFIRKCKCNIEYGTTNTSLIQALRNTKIKVGVKNDLSLNRIVRAIDNGSPIITLVKTDDRNEDHWVVIYGYAIRNAYGEGSGIFVVGMEDDYFVWKEFRKVWANKGFGLICSGPNPLRFRTGKTNPFCRISSVY